MAGGWHLDKADLQLWLGLSGLALLFARTLKKQRANQYKVKTKVSQMALTIPKRWHLSPRVTGGAGTMLQRLALRAFLWATSAGNIHNPFLRHISCPVVGCMSWQVRLIKRMKNMSAKKREKNSAWQRTEVALLETFVKEFNPLVFCARLL